MEIYGNIADAEMDLVIWSGKMYKLQHTTYQQQQEQVAQVKLLQLLCVTQPP